MWWYLVSKNSCAHLLKSSGEKKKGGHFNLCHIKLGEEKCNKILDLSKGNPMYVIYDL